jgi:hypothetical protein
MVKAKEFSDFPCRCGHFLPNVRARKNMGAAVCRAHAL